MAILTFNYYFNGSQNVDENWRGFWESQYVVYGNFGYQKSVFIPPYKHSSFAPNKIQIISNNYTGLGIVSDYPWYIDVINPFIVIPAIGKSTSPTAYLDCIKVEKLNPLHYRDQELRLYFYMTDNFVTDIDNSHYFEIVDNTVLNYYLQLVNIYYPPVS